MTDDKTGRGEKLQRVGDAFASFLVREIRCEAPGCDWWWYTGGVPVCDSCGSGFDSRSAHYLRRIFAATADTS